MTLDEWRFSARLAWQDRFIKWTALGCLFMLCAMTGFILWKLIPEVLQSHVVTLHYTVYLGVDDVRSWQWIFVLPAGLMGILAANTLCTLGLYRHDTLAAKTLSALSVAMTILWTVVSFFLVMVNL